MQVQYSSRYDALKAGKIENIFDPNMAGGALMDLGIYPVTLACALFGAPKTSHYMANKHENGIDLSGIISLHYDTHIFNCVIAKDCASHNETLLIGEKGYLKVEGSISRIDSVEWISKQSRMDYSVDQIDNRMFYEAKDFVDCILNNDVENYEALNQITRDALSVLEKSKADVGLDFGEDALILK
jgi:predicted dehydrogenase